MEKLDLPSFQLGAQWVREAAYGGARRAIRAEEGFEDIQIGAGPYRQLCRRLGWCFGYKQGRIRYIKDKTGHVASH